MIQVCYYFACFCLFSCFVAFIWLLKAFFKVQDSEGQKSFQTISRVGSLATVFLCIGVSFPVSLTWVGILSSIVLSVLSFSVLLGALYINWNKPLNIAFTQSEPEYLVQRGPYAFIRHPFYTSYTLAWLSGVFLSANPWLLLNVLVMGTLYYRAAKFEENQFLNGPLKEHYVAYRKRTGMFVPWIG